MLSVEISNLSDHGPQHSTPVKESFLNKIQRAGNSKHPLQTGRVAELSHVKVNDTSHKYFQCELLHHVDDHNDASSKPNFLDSFIDISQISQIQDISVLGHGYILDTVRDGDNVTISSNHDLDFTATHCDTVHSNDNVTISSNHHLDCPATNSTLRTKQTSGHQSLCPFIANSSPTCVSFKHGKLEQDTINRHDTARHDHAGTQYSRAQLSDCFSDSDLSKPSMSPRNTSSFIKSPSQHKMVKSYRMFRSSSLPHPLLTDVNICNSVDYNLAGCSISDIRRTPSVYIDQDIINKQRQEIQLLMEELGNRDQELNDLVVSHQKQVKAWESDNEKLVSLQGRLSHYEDELRIRENQLKETLSEMARVNEQREVDAVELKQTQNEMIKLAERIMENSLYIKEMEAQNQKLSFSLRDFINARQSFSAREQELLLVIEEKDASLNERQKEIAKMVDHIKYLECQCEQLGERNNNTVVESVNWRKKYFQVKEEADRLSGECRLKEDNVQKMTQQLHESLQQAIALQKALFTSCEREKCKEEVMYSLRKQHKRTMQELQNIRELYDRLSRDTTLYHLSVKEKDSTKDGKKKEDLELLSKRCKGEVAKHVEEADKRKLSGSRRQEANMSKLKHPEACEQSFLVKETKERRQTREEKDREKNANKTPDKNSVSCGEPKTTRPDSYKGRTDETEEHASKLGCVAQMTPQKLERCTPKVFKFEQQMSTPMKSCHTTMYRNAATITSSTSLFSEDVNAQRSRARKCAMRMKSAQGDSKCSETGAAVNGNMSKNADFKDSRSLSNSHISAFKSVQSRTTSPFKLQEVSNKHDASIMERAKDAGGDSSSDASNVSPSRFDDELTPADSDGMCHELQRDGSRVQHLDRLSPMLDASGFESRSSRTPTNSLTVPKKSSFLKKNKTDKKESSAAAKQNTRKRSVEFDASEDLTKSVSAETQSPYLGPESESYSPPSAERRPSIATRGNVYSNTQQYGSSGCQSNKQSPAGREDSGPQHASEASNMKTHPPDVYFQGRGNCLHDTNEPEHKQEMGGEDGHKNNHSSAVMRQKGQMQNNAPQWNVGSCSQCKGQGNCNCSIAPRSHPVFTNQTMGNVEGDVSKQEVRYSCHGGLTSGTSKLTLGEIDSLLEYSSALNQSQNRQQKSVDTARMATCSTPQEVNSSAFHHSQQKMHVNIHEDEPIHDQGLLTLSHQISGKVLPERITTYLANHSSLRRDMFNNNNNTCTDSILNFDLCGCSDNCRHDKKTLLQHGNLVKCVDYIVDDNEEESLPASALLASHSEDMPVCRILNSKKNRKDNFMQQERCIENMKTENVFQEAAGNKKTKEMNPNVCLPASFSCESEHAINSNTGVGSSKLSDKMHVPGLILETGSEDHHPDCTSCHATTKLAAESLLHPEEFVFNCSNERRCKSNCSVKGEPTLAFSKAASAPACRVFHSVSTREPSLYKHLSLIHFSESTRRYEWVTQPVLLEHSMHREDLLGPKSHGHNSTKYKLSGLKSCDRVPAVGSQSQDSITADVTDSRSDSQSSDSGHYSLSTESTDPSSHIGKPIDCRGHSSPIRGHSSAIKGHSSAIRDDSPAIRDDSPAIRDDSSAIKDDSLAIKNDNSALNSPHLFQPHKDRNTSSDMRSNKIINNSGQYNDPNNKNSNNNNNNICNMSHLQWSPAERSTSPLTLLRKFDNVVKKLDFGDIVLEDSGEENEILFLSFSGQQCLPACTSHEGMATDKMTSKSMSTATESHEGILPGKMTSKIISAATETYRCNHESSCLYKEGRCVHALQPITHGSPKYIYPGGAVGCRDQNILKLTNRSFVGASEELQVEREACSEVAGNDQSLANSLDNVDVEEETFSSQNRRKMNKQNNGNEKEVEVREAYTQEDIHGSNFSALPEEGLETSSHGDFYFVKNKRICHANNILVSEVKDSDEDLEEVYSSQDQMYSSNSKRNSHLNKDTPQPEGKQCCHSKVTTHGPRTQGDVEKHQQILEGMHVHKVKVQQYNTVQHQPVEGTIEDTWDSDGSVECQARDTPAAAAAAAVWELGDSVQELAETCEDSMSAFLNVCSQHDQSFMGTALSPVSRLYKLLVESQEMIASLEQNSPVPEVVEFEESPSVTH